MLVTEKGFDWLHVRSGTLEGGIFSPLLSPLFVNDLPAKIKTNCLPFADDVKLYDAKLYHRMCSEIDPQLTAGRPLIFR